MSLVIPCYNSEDYMRHCIESLLPGGGEVEILIVNDGSTDKTAEIAEDYQARYPGIVRVIHQENGGHGAAVNTGIQNASGLFFKVVDSDDWVDREAYAEVCRTLKQLSGAGQLDMLLTNYVYEKEGKKKKTVMSYTNVLPAGRIFTWNETGRFRKGQYILMHSIIYRTAFLRKCGLQLPRHTFYVDNLYAYIPLKDVKTMYYLNVDFYRYYIGRPDQSVHESIMIKRIDQQLKVNRIMLTALALEEIEEPRKRRYMFNYLEIVTVISSILLVRSGTPESLRKKRELWQFIKKQNKGLYKRMRYGLLGQLVHMPEITGYNLSLPVYKVVRKVVGFN
jgi:glycosyltransferase involved in cell wall biosynthesis